MQYRHKTHCSSVKLNIWRFLSKKPEKYWWKIASVLGVFRGQSLGGGASTIITQRYQKCPSNFFILCGYIGNVYIYIYIYTCLKFVTNFVMGLKISCQVGEFEFHFQNSYGKMCFWKIMLKVRCFKTVELLLCSHTPPNFGHKTPLVGTQYTKFWIYSSG